MPSPFPGMDPYLEGSLWTTLHFTLAAEIVRQIAPRLRPKYVALPVERYALEITRGADRSSADMYPDVGVAQVTDRDMAQPRSVTTAPATTAPTATPLRLTTVIPEQVPLVSIEICDVQERRLVTAVEILSPTNKRRMGYREYLKKRRQILLSDTHLIEIDLLRRGRRVPMQEPLPHAQYFVQLSRVEDRPVSLVWPILLDQSLPAVPIPLLAGDGDIHFDLQAAFTASYELLGYELLVNYSAPPEISLNQTEMRLAREFITIDETQHPLSDDGPDAGAGA